MKRIKAPLIIIIMILIGILCGVTWDRDNSTVSVENRSITPETKREIPHFVMALLDSANWYLAETLSVINNKTYGYAFDFYNRTSVIYNDEKIVIEDPTLFSYPISQNNKKLLHIGIAGKSMIVDITDTNSLNKLSSLTIKPKSFKNFKINHWLDTCHSILYHFSIDSPTQSTPHANEIYSWIVEKVNQETPDYEENNSQRSVYKGKKDDINALSRFAANCYFENVRTQYEDLRELPNFIYRNFDMRARVLTDLFVTYQKATYNHAGGAHGYYTEELISYDFINKQEIDWEYLFKPEHQKDVEELFIDCVCQDKKYIYMEDAENREDVIRKFSAKDENWNPTNELLIPQPALSEEGIVFSVQPYDISFFAAGTFHFTIPYEKAEPYMTDKGKKCLGL